MTKNLRRKLLHGFFESRSIWRFVVAVIWVFFLIYQPPLPVSVIYILTAVSLIYIFVSVLFEPSIHKVFLRYMWVFGFMVIYLFIVTMLNKNEISNFSHIFWLMACMFPSGYAVSCLAKNENEDFGYFFHIVLCAALLQAVIAAFAFFVPEIQEKIFDLMIENSLYDEKHLLTWGFRIYGYGTSLMYSIPIVQAVISGWSFIYGIRKNNILYYILSIFILFTAVINAKVSIVVFVYVFIIGFAGTRKLTRKKLLSLCVIGVLFYVAITVARAYLFTENTKLLDWLGLIFDSADFNDLYFGYYTDSTRWQLPDGLGFIFGIGATTNNFGIDSDMGFINDIWLGGLVYSLFIIYILLSLTRDIRKSSRYSSYWKQYVAISLFGTFIIADIKGVAFSYSSFMAFYVLAAMFVIDFSGRRTR